MPCKPAATAKTAGHPRLTPARSFRDDIGVHLTTTMSHRRGSAARGAGAVV